MAWLKQETQRCFTVFYSKLTVTEESQSNRFISFKLFVIYLRGKEEIVSGKESSDPVVLLPDRIQEPETTQVAYVGHRDLIMWTITPVSQRFTFSRKLDSEAGPENWTWVPLDETVTPFGYLCLFVWGKEKRNMERQWEAQKEK